ncbi:MAG: dihydroorotate dehydrogenase [Candidatus Nezhaarchaeota archaeon]|nr:dihydroorotate dehydrogenase [Candidatus Nezhaarchaeota archaeon]MCX8141980.1 dihydroorotate dehydrogenase [Candidatus Nezhaarchaeota archaeon]MDW8050239.1 dihydroorotate dehydrogenase [Nitrososphaerota archaeon]
MDLRVSIASLSLRHPIMLASGILGTTPSMLIKAYNSGASAVITKSLTMSPRDGYPNPVIARVPCGLINAIGLANPGVKNYLDECLEVKDELTRISVIFSIAGFSVNEYVKVAELVTEYGIGKALELNLSCPHVEETRLFSEDPKLTAQVVRAVCDATSLPVFVKVGLTANISEVVESAIKHGASAITAINTIKAMAIDIRAKKPILAAKYGGLSGPAIKPIALRVIYDLYEEFKVPLIGVGGISSWEDVVEFLMAGATAIQVGTIVYKRGLRVFKDLLKGLMNFMHNEGFSSLKDLIGIAH